MSVNNPRLLTPPLQEEEVYPFRRVWRSIAMEHGIYLGITAALFVLLDVISINIPSSLHSIIAPILALLPVGLWLIFSWFAERQARQPRQRLLAIAIISALAANAIGIPLVNDFFTVDRWLPLSSAINRIVGYTFTVGIAHETIKYLVLRYTLGNELLRTRFDFIAYAAASAVGYAGALNLHMIAVDGNTPTPDVVAARVFATCVLHLITSVIVSYGLSEVEFGTSNPILLMLTLAVASIVAGIAIPIRAGLVNSGLSFGINTTRPLFGIAFSAALLVVPLLIVSFLYDSAERRAYEASLGEDD